MTPDVFVEWLGRIMPGWCPLVSVNGDDWRLYLIPRGLGPERRVFDLPGAGAEASVDLNRAMRRIATAMSAIEPSSLSTVN